MKVDHRNPRAGKLLITLSVILILFGIILALGKGLDGDSIIIIFVIAVIFYFIGKWKHWMAND
jgi:hypothetical protein